MTFDGAATYFNAHYDGDAAYGPADSGRTDLAAARIATAVTLAVPPNLAFGAAATLTARVTPADGGTAIVPAGTVRFLANGIELGRAQLDPTGTATVTTGLLVPGEPVLSASYLGSSACLPSQSAGTPVSVRTGLLLSPLVRSANPAPAGVPVVFDFKLRSGNLPPGTRISLSASGLPTGATATFTPSTLLAGSLEQTFRMVVDTTAPSTPGPMAKIRLVGTGGGGLLACGLLALPFGRRRRRLLGFLAVLVLVSLGGLQGCIPTSSGSSVSTPPGTYTVRVQAGSAVTSATIVQVTLTVLDPAAK
jgi:hypothetical protein